MPLCRAPIQLFPAHPSDGPGRNLAGIHRRSHFPERRPPLPLCDHSTKESITVAAPLQDLPERLRARTTRILEARRNRALLSIASAPDAERPMHQGPPPTPLLSAQVGSRTHTRPLPCLCGEPDSCEWTYPW